MNLFDNERVQSNFAKNMIEFRERYPAVYEYFKKYTPNTTKLVIDAEGQIDLKYKDQSLYQGDAVGYVSMEVERFLSRVKSKTAINVMPADKIHYSNPRLFSMTANQVLKLSPVDSDGVEKPIDLAEGLPGVMFIGVGLGLHIESLLNEVPISNVIILEHEPDLFYFSMAAIDWGTIFRRYDEIPGSKITFTIGRELDGDALRNLIWNNVVRNYPLFPILSLFYNHLDLEKVDRAIASVEKDYLVEVASWGNYDDECNQINHALYNRSAEDMGVFTIPNISDYQIDFDRERPIIVVGSGPSLDINIESLKSIADRVTIISSGSAITALLKNGITPDLHCELESDYRLTIGTYESITDRDRLRSIPLIAPIQISPYAAGYFKETLYFNREGSSVSSLLSDSVTELPFAAPTCSNLAVALVQYYGCKAIYLVGIDFGFETEDKHHSCDSVYYDETADSSLSEANERVTVNLFKVEGNRQREVWTRPDYYYAKRRLETSFAHYNQVLEKQSFYSGMCFYNVSFGAKIDNTIYVEDLGSIEEEVSRLRKKSTNDFSSWLVNNKNNINDNRSRTDLIGEVTEQISQATIGLTDIIESTIGNSWDLYLCGNRLSDELEYRIFDSSPTAYRMLIGSMKHFFYIALTHLAQVESNSDCFSDYVDRWRQSLLKFMKILPRHIARRLDGYANIEDDSALRLSITEPLDLDEEMFDGIIN